MNSKSVHGFKNPLTLICRTSLAFATLGNENGLDNREKERKEGSVQRRRGRDSETG